MAAKSQSRLSGKSNKSSSSMSSKADGKGRKKVTMEDEDGVEKDAMAYKVLSAEHTNELMGLNVVQIQDKLREIFNLENSGIDLTQAATLDYYTSAVWWAIQQKFTAQQVSGLFSVVHTLLENVREKQMSMVDNMTELKKMFVGIGLDDVKSHGLDFFTVQQARAVTEYVYSSFFQHYKLYLYMFTHSQAEEIIGTDLEVEVAKAADVPFPPPLDEGVTEEMYRDYIATPPPTPSPESRGSDRESKSANSCSLTPRSARKSSGSGKKSRSPSRRGSSRASAKGKKVPEEVKPDPAKELEDQVSQSDVFADLTADDVREVIESVTKEMLGTLQSDVGNKLREKENQILQRINKIHKVAD